jgi:transcription initiation factor IIE alpha subunit
MIIKLFLKQEQKNAIIEELLKRIVQAKFRYEYSKAMIDILEEKHDLDSDIVKAAYRVNIKDARRHLNLVKRYNRVKNINIWKF